MTRTITSNAPGSGTSISSSWKASFGSPSRSSRITQAAIVSGSSPGSTPTSETFVTSTAIGGGRLPCGLGGLDRFDGLGRSGLGQGGGVVVVHRLSADQPERDHHAARGNPGGEPHAARKRVDERVVRGAHRDG